MKKMLREYSEEEKVVCIDKKVFVFIQTQLMTKLKVENHMLKMNIFYQMEFRITS